MYYVYKTTNIVNNKIYIGVHKSDNIQSDSYIGSGLILNKSILKYGIDKFKREILYQFQKQSDAYDMERLIVNKQFVKRKDTYNIKQGGSGGQICGFVTVKDINRNTYYVKRDDPRYLSGQLVFVCKGLISVKDKNGNTFKTDRNDPRWLSGQLVGVATGIRKPDGHGVGSKNSQYGTMWITNGIQNKKIKKDSIIPAGWYNGRKLK